MKKCPHISLNLNHNLDVLYYFVQAGQIITI